MSGALSPAQVNAISRIFSNISRYHETLDTRSRSQAPLSPAATEAILRHPELLRWIAPHLSDEQADALVRGDVTDGHE